MLASSVADLQLRALKANVKGREMGPALRVRVRVRVFPFCLRVSCESTPDTVGLMCGGSPARRRWRPDGPPGAGPPVRPTDAQEPLQTGGRGGGGVGWAGGRVETKWWTGSGDSRLLFHPVEPLFSGKLTPSLAGPHPGSSAVVREEGYSVEQGVSFLHLLLF